MSIVIRFGMMLCLLVASGLPASAAPVREPYLQLTTPVSVTIVWRTNLTCSTDSRVQFGTNSSNLDQTATGGASSPLSNSNVLDHVVTVGGLSPGTQYFYNVGTTSGGGLPADCAGGGTTEHFFVTAPTVGSATPFTAWVVGDSGNASANQIAVRNAMLAETGANPPSIFLPAGDNAYESGTDAEFTNNHFAIYRDILRHTPSWPTLGNHESFSVNTSLQTGPYYEAHVLPTNGQAGGVASSTEAYYSFDYANAHFIVLDSMDSSRAPGSAMLTWLQNDLAGTTQEWVIAYFHHPPYTKGTHNSDNPADSGGRLIDMRETVLPILEAGGVDLVLAGHSHIYERSYPLSGAHGYGVTTPDFGTLLANGNILDTGDGNPLGGGAYQNGTVYVVAGHGGRSVGGTGNHPVMFFSEVAFGSVLLDINGSILTVQNVRSTGAITDTFSINKTGLGATGLVDIVLRNTATGEVAVWVGNGVNAPTTSGVIGSAPTTWTIVGMGDMDGNGTDDIVWREPSTGAVAVWLGNGANAPTTMALIGNAPTTWTIVGIGDLDGNGTDDIVWREPSTGAVAVWLGNGANAPTTTAVIGGAPTTWIIEGIGDMNGNGTDDIVWREPSTGDVAVWLGNGANAPTTMAVIGGAPTTWAIVGMGDTDGNGADDIVWYETSTGAVAVWLGNGANAPTTTGLIGSAPTTWAIVGMGDMDNDGKVDLVWRETTTGVMAVAVWLINGVNAPTATGVIGGAPIVWQIQP